jgi:hypothetical protein
MKFNSFFNLPGDRFPRIAVRRVEPAVVAVCAAAGSFGTITVWTGKPGIHRNLLNPPAESFFNVFRISVEPSGMIPGIWFVSKHLTKKKWRNENRHWALGIRVNLNFINFRNFMNF